MSREQSTETTKHLGVWLTVRAWHHVAIAIAVQWLGRESKTWEQSDEGEEHKDPDLPDGDDEEEVPTSVVEVGEQSDEGMAQGLPPLESASGRLFHNPTARIGGICWRRREEPTEGPINALSANINDAAAARSPIPGSPKPRQL